MRAGLSFPKLFPLNRGGRLTRNIVGYAGNTGDLVDDAVGNGLLELAGCVRPPSSHKIDHRQSNYPVIDQKLELFYKILILCVQGDAVIVKSPNNKTHTFDKVE